MTLGYTWINVSVKININLLILKYTSAYAYVIVCFFYEQRNKIKAGLYDKT